LLPNEFCLEMILPVREIFPKKLIEKEEKKDKGARR
jgi:hypothetical protein